MESSLPTSPSRAPVCAIIHLISRRPRRDRATLKSCLRIRLWLGSYPFCLLSILWGLFTNPTFAQEGPEHHAESDRYWADLAKSYPAFVVDQSQLRVAAANELNTLGEWGPVLDWPHIPVSAAHLPDGRILTWASNDEEGFPGGQPEFTYAAAWDPSDESFKDGTTQQP